MPRCNAYSVGKTSIISHDSHAYSWLLQTQLSVEEFKYMLTKLNLKVWKIHI